MGACALILLVLPATAQSQSDADLGAQLTRHLSTMKKDRQVLRFLETTVVAERSAVRGRRQAAAAAPPASLARHRRSGLQRRSAALAHAGGRQDPPARRREGRDAAQSVICRVFGSYCQEALAVSRCESGLSTDAQNGQYLGLFQMGSSERRLFGHGSTPIAQAKAAHRYFVASGRDWGPWSCKPWS